MRAKRSMSYAPSAIVPFEPCVCRIFDFAPAFGLVWSYRAEEVRGEGVGIRDIRVGVYTVHSGNPETPRHSYS
jgi:hypothetical protein